jgi:hypothetical protein
MTRMSGFSQIIRFICVQNRKAMRKIIATALALFVTLYVGAETITISFPGYAGKKYDFYRWKGLERDTVASGVIGEKGEAKITFDSGNFRGVATLDFGRAGALDVILNGENEFSISNSLLTESNEARFSYSNSPENQFVMDRAEQQKRIFTKNDLLNYISQIYSASEPFYPAAQSERNNVENQYEQMQQQMHESPLYAARLCEVFDYINGRGSRLTMSDSVVARERKDFVLNKLDFGALYTSGEWEKVTADWIWNLTGSDSLLIAETRHVLNRIPDSTTKLQLAERVMQLYSKYAKTDLLPQLNVENLQMPMLGQAAPALILNDEVVQPKNALILFYDSRNTKCLSELNQLKERQNLLAENGLRVISIAADTDKDLDGKNFVSYGIVGTPTLIVVDKDGIVRGRYARLKDFME